MILVIEIYKWIDKLPKSERFGLISQIKRAAVSLPSNLAEGSGRSSTKELIRYIDISSGSLSELETQLILVHKLNFHDTSDLVCKDLIVIRKMLFKLKKSLGSKVVKR
jgi:four helix bundle protein